MAGQPAPNTDVPDEQGLFQDRNFLFLWLVSTVHNLGEKLFFVFLIMLADFHGNHSNSVVSALSLASSIPSVLFGSVAGVFVDRFSLRGLMIVAGLSRALLILAIPFAGDAVWPLLGFSFGFSVLTRFHDPAFMKAIPALVRKDHLMAANSVFMTTMVGALIGSFALAGPIWRIAGASRAHLVVVALYVVCALGAAFLRVPKDEKKQQQGEAPKGSFWAEWSFAFAYLKAHPRLLKAYSMTMTMFGTFAALNVIAKGFALSALKTTDPADFTYILAFVGLGMVLGALTLGRWGMRFAKPTLIRTGFILAGSAILALSIVGGFAMAIAPALVWPLVYALAIIVGAGGACIEIPISTLLQEGIEEEVRGRIFGVQAMLMNLASTLPMAIAGPLADLWGPAVVMGLFGLLMGGMAFLRLAGSLEKQEAR
jgi:MFS family permease